MKKIMTVLVAGVVMFGLAFAVYAADAKVKVDKKGDETTVTADTQKAKTKVEVKKEGGEIKSAEIDKQAKGTNPVLKKVVKFDSVSQDGMYITVVDRDEKIRYMTNDPKRPYIVKWKKMEPIEITATYDVNAGQYVLDQAMIAPATQPMKEISKDEVGKILTKDAPKQPVEKKAEEKKAK